MAIIINTINNEYFELNNIKYPKQYIPTKQGVNHLAIGSSQNTAFKILNSTHYSEIVLNSKTFESLNECINDLLPVIYSNKDLALEDKISELELRITALENKLNNESE